MNEVRLWMVLARGLTLYVLANLAFAWFDPPVGKLSIYNWIIPGRERVPYEREVEYYGISHTIPIYEDMDAMYRSTTLSRSRRPDEFRVFLLGDSSAWGFQLEPQETLAGQLNALGLRTCDGRRIIAYNAAFPLPYIMKDLLIMDKVREYEPDMFVWLITLDGFRNRTIFTDYFLDPYAARVSDLVEQYDIENLDTRGMTGSTFWDRTIVGQRSRLKKLLFLQLHGLGWDATGLDYYYQDYPPLSHDQADDDSFFEMSPGELDLENSMLFDVLAAGYRHADVPVLTINEPIFISAGENSDIRYNEFYPRWAYDGYLDYLAGWMPEHAVGYVNAWDLLPASEFTDTPFHRSPAGEMRLAEFIMPTLLDLSCTQ